MTTRAIILKKQNTNECDQLITCYTEDFGKLMAIAKSILKPSSIQAMHLDIFNLAEFELIQGHGMPIITGAQMLDSHMNIKRELSKLAVAYFFAEAMDKMVFDNDKDENLWSFWVSLLDELDDDDSKPLDLLRQGQIKLLGILGYFPEVGSCKVCSDKLNENSFGAFNHNLGGIICQRCFLSGYGGILISRNDFKLMAGSADEFNKKNYERSVLDGIFEYVSGARFSSLDLFGVLK